MKTGIRFYLGSTNLYDIERINVYTFEIYEKVLLELDSIYGFI